jgi:hypothetical protein
MLKIGSFDVRYLHSETMWKRRAIAAIQPIKGNTVLFAETEGRLDG